MSLGCGEVACLEEPCTQTPHERMRLDRVVDMEVEMEPPSTPAQKALSAPRSLASNTTTRRTIAMPEFGTDARQGTRTQPSPST